MGASMRTIVILLLTAATASADVLVLKDGRKFSGKVVEKGGVVEVTTEGGLKSFLKEEVEKTITSPAELLGDSEKILEEVKQEYLKAVQMSDTAAQNAKLKESAAKLIKVREAYGSAREFFWEDKYADLDVKLVQVMQLLRMLRGHMSSDFARRADAPPPVVVKPPPPPPVSPQALSVQQAFAAALDPAQRADASKRAGAQGVLRANRTAFAGGVDLANAALALLSRPDKDWKLEGASLAALQEYFGKPWLKEPEKLTPAAHLEAAKFLSEKMAAVKKAGGAADAHQLFAIGHLGQVAAGEAEKLAPSLGLVAKEGVVGTPEGHSVYDLSRWIERGDFDLAVLAYMKESRGTAGDTPGVRFLWSYALLRMAQHRKKGYDRPAKAFDAVAPPDPAAKDHMAALAKSVRNVGVCSTCSGEGKIRCNGCQGKKEVRFDCAKCKGVGAVNLVSCGPCKGRGFDKLGRCTKCKDGYPECHACDKRPRTPPEMEDICMGTGCGACDGTGILFQKALLPCRACLGLGQKLTPRADPSKILP